MQYADFLRAKIKLASFDGFDVPLEEINPELKPHTRDLVRWGVKGGNRAWFASFGLHKTATQLETLRLIGVHRPGLRLQVLPLGVRQEFFREAQTRFHDDFAIDLRFIRSDSEIGDGMHFVSFYEAVEGVRPAYFQAYTSKAKSPKGRKPWTVDNRRIGRDGYGFSTFDEAARACAEDVAA